MSMLEGSHRQLTAMLREQHSLAMASPLAHAPLTHAEGSGVSLVRHSTAPGLTCGEAITQMGTCSGVGSRVGVTSPSGWPSAALVSPTGLSAKSHTPPTAFAMSAIGSSQDSGLHQYSHRREQRHEERHVAVLTPPTVRQQLVGDGTHEGLLPAELIATSIALQETAAPRLRALMEPVALFALNSPAHRQRVQAQIAESAREANHAGLPARAAELFERAHAVHPTRALLISALNMRLKSGEAGVALAGERQ